MGCGAAECFNTTDARSDGAFGLDLKHADVTCVEQNPVRILVGHNEVAGEPVAAARLAQPDRTGSSDDSHKTLR